MLHLPHHFIEHKIAQTLAFAVRQMAANESWVAPSAAAHNGRVIAIIATVLNQPLHLAWRVDATQILCALNDNTKAADVTLTILPAAYAAAAQLPFDMTRIMRHVQISGDAGLAEWVNRLAQQLRPDVWEDLSQLIGDTPTQLIAQGFNAFITQFKQVGKSVVAQAQYVALDEHPIGVRHAHLDEFVQAAQDVRYQLDRLEQRVALLQARL